MVFDEPKGLFIDTTADEGEGKVWIGKESKFGRFVLVGGVSGLLDVTVD